MYINTHLDVSIVLLNTLHVSHTDIKTYVSWIKLKNTKLKLKRSDKELLH